MILIILTEFKNLSLMRTYQFQQCPNDSVVMVQVIHPLPRNYFAARVPMHVVFRDAEASMALAE